MSRALKKDLRKKQQQLLQKNKFKVLEESNMDGDVVVVYEQRGDKKVRFKQAYITQCP